MGKGKLKLVVLACIMAASVSMFGCDAQKAAYEDGVAMYEAGDYAGALASFSELEEEYENSATYIADAKWYALHDYVVANGTGSSDGKSSIKKTEGDATTYITVSEEDPETIELSLAVAKDGLLESSENGTATFFTLKHHMTTAEASTISIFVNSGAYQSKSQKTSSGKLSLRNSTTTVPKLDITSSTAVVDNSGGVGGGWVKTFDGTNTECVYADGSVETKTGDQAYPVALGAFSDYPELIANVSAMLSETGLGVTLYDLGFTDSSFESLS